jgi:hypothetical protein
MIRMDVRCRVGGADVLVLWEVFRRIQSSCLSCTFGQDVFKQNGVAGVAFEYGVRDIPKEGNQANSPIEQEVPDHYASHLFYIFGVFASGYSHRRINEPECQEKIKTITDAGGFAQYRVCNGTFNNFRGYLHWYEANETAQAGDVTNGVIESKGPFSELKEDFSIIFRNEQEFFSPFLLPDFDNTAPSILDLYFFVIWILPRWCQFI